MNVQRVRVNDMIRISPLRVIGPDNEQLGVIDLDEARADTDAEASSDIQLTLDLSEAHGEPGDG